MVANHGLYGYALELIGPEASRDGALNPLPSRPHGGFVLQVQFDACGLGLVRDGVRVEFQHHGESDFRGELHRCVFGRREFGSSHRNGVGGQQPLGFVLRQQDAAFGPGCIEHGRGGAMIHGALREFGSLVQGA